MKIGKVDTEEISIVVQGPVIWNKDYYETGWTFEVLNRARHFFPGSEIILSTWKGQNIDGLSFDFVIFNDDPGPLNTKDSSNNLNRQIVSTSSGLKKATRRYAMKLRTDTIFNNNCMISYFAKYPCRIETWKMFKERIVTDAALNPKHYLTPFPFQIPDWIHFGFREDLLILWDIPLAEKPNFERFMCSPEQYIWTSCIKKFGNIHFEHGRDNRKENVYLTELIIANNVVPLDRNQMGIEFWKFPGDKEKSVLDNRKRNKIIQVLDDFTQRTFNYNYLQWQKLYKKYCCGKTLQLPHLFYDLINPFVASLYVLSKRSLKNIIKNNER